MEDEAPLDSRIRDHGENQGEVVQGISLREMFGRRSLTWVAQATEVVWEQVGLWWRWQNEEGRELGAHFS